MAQFYGSVTGQGKNPAGRCGSKNSGLQAHIRGWNKGVWIMGYYDELTKQDCFDVYITGGSNNPGEQKRIAVIRGDNIKLED